MATRRAPLKARPAATVNRPEPAPGSTIRPMAGSCDNHATIDSTIGRGV